MVAKNDVTGDAIQSKVNSEAFKSNWDSIFGKKEKKEDTVDQEKRLTEDEEKS